MDLVDAVVSCLRWGSATRCRYAARLRNLHVATGDKRSSHAGTIFSHHPYSPTVVHMPVDWSTVGPYGAVVPAVDWQLESPFLGNRSTYYYTICTNIFNHSKFDVQYKGQ